MSEKASSHLGKIIAKTFIVTLENGGGIRQEDSMGEQN